jgi:hypothetical protein
MAFTKIPAATTLQLVYKLGTDADGHEVKRRRSFTDIKTDAVADEVGQVGATLANLQKNTLAQMLLIDKNELANMG